MDDFISGYRGWIIYHSQRNFDHTIIHKKLCYAKYLVRFLIFLLRCSGKFLITEENTNYPLAIWYAQCYAAP